MIYRYMRMCALAMLGAVVLVFGWALDVSAQSGDIIPTLSFEVPQQSKAISTPQSNNVDVTIDHTAVCFSPCHFLAQASQQTHWMFRIGFTRWRVDDEQEVIGTLTADQGEYTIIWFVGLHNGQTLNGQFKIQIVEPPVLAYNEYMCDINDLCSLKLRFDSPWPDDVDLTFYVNGLELVYVDFDEEGHWLLFVFHSGYETGRYRIEMGLGLLPYTAAIIETNVIVVDIGRVRFRSPPSNGYTQISH